MYLKALIFDYHYLQQHLTKIALFSNSGFQTRKIDYSFFANPILNFLVCPWSHERLAWLGSTICFDFHNLCSEYFNLLILLLFKPVGNWYTLANFKNHLSLFSNLATFIKKTMNYLWAIFSLQCTAKCLCLF